MPKIQQQKKERRKRRCQKCLVLIIHSIHIMCTCTFRNRAFRLTRKFERMHNESVKSRVSKRFRFWFLLFLSNISHIRRRTPSACRQTNYIWHFHQFRLRRNPFYGKSIKVSRRKVTIKTDCGIRLILIYSIQVPKQNRRTSSFSFLFSPSVTRKDVTATFFTPSLEMMLMM